MALTLLGGIGLTKAGALDARMRALIAAIETAGNSYSFWLPVDER